MLNRINIIFGISIKIILFFGLLSLFNINKVINIDNLINESLYQENQDFSKFSTKYKILAIYYPQNFTNFDETKYSVDKKKSKSIIQEDEENKFKKTLIYEQVKLAKNHGIFGFGIVYNVMNNHKSNEEIFNFFSSDKMNNFPFFIIINNKGNNDQQDQNLLNQNIIYNKEDLISFVDNIKIYITSDNYIKIKDRPILGFFQSSLTYHLIINFRKLLENKKNKIHILHISYGKNDLDYMNITNSFVKFPSKNIGLTNNLTQQYFYNFYYPNLFNNENIRSKGVKFFFIINGSLPEKFYIIFRRYLNSFEPDIDEFLLFNAWNNYQENYFLEPNEENGYAYLNYLSKAIFNLDDNKVYDLAGLYNRCKIAVQVHLFYDDLIKDVINKTNNIPVKFDLYITITSPEIKDKLRKYIKIFSKANYFEILIVENKGRDVLPFLNQIKTKFKFYKYICHIHTKKSLTAPEIGNLWRNYLYGNLLGNSTIVSEILYDFEKIEKLGFIFPETFYGIIQHFYILTEGTKNWMNFIAKKLFPNYKIGELANFPAGNMFWAKIQAISQIFSCDFSKYFPNEDDQTNDTIMHGIERIWLYLVQFNHFYYKIIFKFF